MFVHVKSESSHGLCNRKIEIQREINISLLTISKACERKKKIERKIDVKMSNITQASLRMLKVYMSRKREVTENLRW